MLVYKEVTSIVASRVLERSGEGMEDGWEMVHIFDVRR
jgi:hypothetical protein